MIAVTHANLRKCLAVLQGHTSLVGQLQMRGDTLVTGGSDGSVRVWSLERLVPIHRLAAHDNSVTSLQFNESRIVSGGSDGRVKVWDTKAGTLVRELSQPADAVWRVVFEEEKAIIMANRAQRTIMEVRPARFFLQSHTLRKLTRSGRSRPLKRLLSCSAPPQAALSPASTSNRPKRVPATSRWWTRQTTRWPQRRSAGTRDGGSSRRRPPKMGSSITGRTAVERPLCRMAMVAARGKDGGVCWSLHARNRGCGHQFTGTCIFSSGKTTSYALDRRWKCWHLRIVGVPLRSMLFTGDCLVPTRRVLVLQ